MTVVLTGPLRGQTADTPAAAPILAGEPADISTHPWQLAIDANGKLCGGALVAPSWALTAASCLEDVPQPFDVRVKAEPIEISPDGAWTRAAKVVRHEGFTPRDVVNDLALIKLRRQPGGKPIPLVTDYTSLHPGQKLEVAGWWRPADRTGPARLLRAEVQMTPKQLCDEASVAAGARPDSLDLTICTEHADGSPASCDGDPGAPLVLKKWSGPVLVGVMASGNACAAHGKLGIFNRVVAYRSWIGAVMQANQD